MKALARFSPTRFMNRQPAKKMIEVLDDEDADADDEEVVEVVQLEFEDEDASSTEDIMEAPTKLSRNTVSVMLAVVWATINDYVLSPIATLTALYWSLAISSKIGILLITASFTTVLYLNQRPDHFPADAYNSVVSYLPPSIPKWGDVIPFSSYLDKSTLLVQNWYNSVIATNFDRLTTFHIYIPQMFQTGDGELRTAKHWNIFFPSRDTESTIGKAVSTPSPSSLITFDWSQLVVPLKHSVVKTGNSFSDAWNQTTNSLHAVLTSVQNYWTFSSTKKEGRTRAPVQNKFASEADKIDFKHPLPVDSALLQRVQHLEKVISQIQDGFKTASGSFDDLSGLLGESGSRIDTLQGRVVNMAVKVEHRLKGLDEKDVEAARALKELKEWMKRVSDNVDGLVKGFEGKQGLEEHVKAVEDKLGKFYNELSVRIAENNKSIDAKLAELIRKDEIPSLMVAHKDPKTGKVTLQPELLKLLKEKLDVAPTVVTHQPAPVPHISESRIQELISEHVSHSADKLQSQLSQLPDLDTIQQQIDSTLQRELSESLKTIPTTSQLHQAISAKTTEFLQRSKEMVNEVLAGGPDHDESKTILTREQIVNILQQQIAEAKTSITQQFEERLDEVNPANRAKLDVEAMKAVMDSLIQSALTKYAADGIGREDFALEGNGALVIQELTSNPYSIPSASRLGRLLGHKLLRDGVPLSR
ncbi:hypothetical protein BCR33DRAFT_557405 [Rhizoclosmatium globosum]|uniref:SUN domain-containing protein n=1 Tax=Rhizoclosmatium globosum TaxID=329046 RepID=A0A1Y2CUG6_9FUNG|nr:hypothetical protein BCR33DRAFT_557405 [Rhizoclosmatium globosum]|eukprot:ORY49955.1 hypothetical protein BCR33DRAFT_557405 [Rhizoclosmatium globosum]